jgi:hypothetical protein
VNQQHAGGGIAVLATCGRAAADFLVTGFRVFKLMTAQQSPDIYRPNCGNMLYVLELANSQLASGFRAGASRHLAVMETTKAAR